MARQKKPVHRVQMTDGKRNIIRQLLEEYDIETAEDIQDALKDLLGGTIKEMMVPPSKSFRASWISVALSMLYSWNSCWMMARLPSVISTL